MVGLVGKLLREREREREYKCVFGSKGPFGYSLFYWKLKTENTIAK